MKHLKTIKFGDEDSEELWALVNADDPKDFNFEIPDNVEDTGQVLTSDVFLTNLPDRLNIIPNSSIRYRLRTGDVGNAVGTTNALYEDWKTLAQAEDEKNWDSTNKSRYPTDREKWATRRYYSLKSGIYWDNHVDDWSIHHYKGSPALSAPMFFQYMPTRVTGYIAGGFVKMPSNEYELVKHSDTVPNDLELGTNVLLDPDHPDWETMFTDFKDHFNPHLIKWTEETHPLGEEYADHPQPRLTSATTVPLFLSQPQDHNELDQSSLLLYLASLVKTISVQHAALVELMEAYNTRISNLETEFGLGGRVSTLEATVGNHDTALNSLLGSIRTEFNHFSYGDYGYPGGLNTSSSIEDVFHVMEVAYPLAACPELMAPQRIILAMHWLDGLGWFSHN